MASGNKATATVLDFDQDAENLAAYAQGNVGLTDTIDLVLGARWTKDDKTGSFVQRSTTRLAACCARRRAVDLELDDDEFTYRVGLNWTPNADLLVFGSYSTGYKSGGFNSGGGNAALGQRRLFDKETSDNYEVGAKWTLAEGRAHLNGTVFLMDLGDFQDRAFDGQSFNVINAGSMRNQGVETRRELCAARLVVTCMRRWATSTPNSPSTTTRRACRIRRWSPTARRTSKVRRPVFAPEWQGAAGFQLQGDLGLADMGYLFRTDVSYMDDINVNQINDNNPQGIQSAYTLVSARFSLLFGADRQFAVSLFGDNLTDEDYFTGTVAQPFDNLLRPARPGVARHRHAWTGRSRRARTVFRSRSRSS